MFKLFEKELFGIVELMEGTNPSIGSVRSQRASKPTLRYRKPLVFPTFAHVYAMMRATMDCW
jgi:hypothetical protein